MSAITTHLLDTVLGRPASHVEICLERNDGSTWLPVAHSASDQDGRCRDLIADAPPGLYRLTFHVAPYFARHNRQSLYPEISVVFQCTGEPHYHLPLLLSDNSYTTYRGS